MLFRSEIAADENNVCRQIVREITNFQVNQRQTLVLIYLLAAELEDVGHMKAITRFVRELGGSDIFLIGAPQEEGD